MPARAGAGKLAAVSRGNKKQEPLRRRVTCRESSIDAISDGAASSESSTDSRGVVSRSFLMLESVRRITRRVHRGFPGASPRGFETVTSCRRPLLHEDHPATGAI